MDRRSFLKALGFVTVAAATPVAIAESMQKKEQDKLAARTRLLIGGAEISEVVYWEYRERTPFREFYLVPSGDRVGRKQFAEYDEIELNLQVVPKSKADRIKLAKLMRVAPEVVPTVPVELVTPVGAFAGQFLLRRFDYQSNGLVVDMFFSRVMEPRWIT